MIAFCHLFEKKQYNLLKTMVFSGIFKIYYYVCEVMLMKKIKKILLPIAFILMIAAACVYAFIKKDDLAQELSTFAKVTVDFVKNPNTTDKLVIAGAAVIILFLALIRAIKRRKGKDASFSACITILVFGALFGYILRDQLKSNILEGEAIIKYGCIAGVGLFVLLLLICAFIPGKKGPKQPFTYKASGFTIYFITMVYIALAAVYLLLVKDGMAETGAIVKDCYKYLFGFNETWVTPRQKIVVFSIMAYMAVALMALALLKRKRNLLPICHVFAGVTVVFIFFQKKETIVGFVDRVLADGKLITNAVYTVGVVATLFMMVVALFCLVDVLFALVDKDEQYVAPVNKAQTAEVKALAAAINDESDEEEEEPAKEETKEEPVVAAEPESDDDDEEEEDEEEEAPKPVAKPAPKAKIVEYADEAYDEEDDEEDEDDDDDDEEEDDDDDDDESDDSGSDDAREALRRRRELIRQRILAARYEDDDDDDEDVEEDEVIGYDDDDEDDDDDDEEEVVEEIVEEEPEVVEEDEASPAAYGGLTDNGFDDEAEEDEDDEEEEDEEIPASEPVAEETPEEEPEVEEEAPAEEEEEDEESLEDEESEQPEVVVAPALEPEEDEEEEAPAEEPENDEEPADDEESDDDDDDDDDSSSEGGLSIDGKPIFAKGKSKPMKEKMITVMDEEKRERYNTVRNALQSYKKVSERLAAKGETFRFKREQIAKIDIGGKTLKLHLALNPDDFQGSKYSFQDLSEKKKYMYTPLTVKLTSGRSVKHSLELIEMVAEAFGLEKNPRYQEKDYASELKEQFELEKALEGANEPEDNAE